MPPYALSNARADDSFGPETITISQRIPHTYSYFVHNYSAFDGGSVPLAGCGARVTVYTASGSSTIAVPAVGSGVWWHVFDIAPDGAIVMVNALANTRDAGAVGRSVGSKAGR